MEYFVHRQNLAHYRRLLKRDGIRLNRRGCQALRHCEPTGPARSGRPDDRLREAIHNRVKKGLDCSRLRARALRRA
jgi:hypothetical protein